MVITVIARSGRPRLRAVAPLVGLVPELAGALERERKARDQRVHRAIRALEAASPRRKEKRVRP